MTTPDRIADYFCILSTGDKLQLKQNSNSKINECKEQQAALVERFYREIVSCKIICIPNDLHDGTDTDNKNNIDRNRNSIVQRYKDDGYVVIEKSVVSVNKHNKHLHDDSSSNNNNFNDDYYFSANLNPLFDVMEERRRRDSNQNNGKFLVDDRRRQSGAGMVDSVESNAHDHHAPQSLSNGNQSPSSLSSTLLSPSFRAAGVAGHKVHNLIRGSQSKMISIRNNSGLNLNLSLNNSQRQHQARNNKRVQYFLAYRRRGPEDKDLAGVAELDVFYACVPRTSDIDDSNGKQFDSILERSSNITTAGLDRSRKQINAVMKRTWNKAATSINGLRNSDDARDQSNNIQVSLSYKRRERDIIRSLEDIDYEDCDEDDNSSTSSLGLHSQGNHKALHLHSRKQQQHQQQQEHWALVDIVAVPSGYDEIVLPEGFESYAVPRSSLSLHDSRGNNIKASSPNRNQHVKWHNYDSNFKSPDNNYYLTKTHLSPQNEEIETSYLSPMSATSAGNSASLFSDQSLNLSPHKDLGALIKLYSEPPSECLNNPDAIILPVLAIRRQRTGENERFHEDSALCDLSISFRPNDMSSTTIGKKSVSPILPFVKEDDEEEESEKLSFLKKTEWHVMGKVKIRSKLPILLVRKNDPIGFADIPFEASMQDRFPSRDYEDLPMPVEELPLFCFPQGCCLLRAQLCDIPLPSSYGFVLKNIQRGDSIYVACVSFYEPIVKDKIKQLNEMSRNWKRTSLAHARYCHEEEVNSRSSRLNSNVDHDQETLLFSHLNIDDKSDSILVGFDKTVTFENKVICLISRSPYWTIFRRFLGNLHSHSISGSCDLPLERLISHLLLTVPLPSPGGPIIEVPLSSWNSILSISMPALKDLPLLNLSFAPLFSCMDIPTIIVVALGFLALERKIIVISTHSHLLINVCELFRSLLFPFELCAPYVPRLTETFISTLEFPGAVFVGIHDDGCAFAKGVRQNIPEEALLLDLDTCEIHSNEDRFEVVRQCWNIIPSNPRSALVTELEILCQDAGIVPGQEPLESQIDLAFDSGIDQSNIFNNDESAQCSHQRLLDDRAVRDAFLRFFCAILGGYERYLVVPDVDFMISGNEWFDSQGFVSIAQSDFAPYLGFLVSTQLFQSFIQKRTESSDMHCLLFDECLTEYHSVQNRPYGRLGSDCAVSEDIGETVYSLLIDQCASESYQVKGLDTTAAADSTHDHDPFENNFIDKSLSFAESSISIGAYSVSHSNKQVVTKMVANEQSTDTSWTTNHARDPTVVTCPDKRNLPSLRFSYFVDGHPCFPHKFNTSLFYPYESNTIPSQQKPDTLAYLIRSGNEVTESERRRIAASSRRGLHSKRRCLWQLPKLMASHVLGAWLMCIPTQVSQKDIASDQRERYLLRALGAMRLLRNRHRVIPDEASYRALMVACGRVNSDRRPEIVKLFGMLRSDDIFPSAVTLGQYTKAVAEGFSKRTTTSEGSVIDAESSSNITEQLLSGNVSALDTNLSILEQAGRGWRKRSRKRHGSSSSLQSFPWGPILSSSSLVEADILPKTYDKEKFRFVALWSKASSCDQCEYEPLDEEIQANWDITSENNNTSCNMLCPRCENIINPLIGYRILNFAEANELNFKNNSKTLQDKKNAQQELESERVRNVANSTPHPPSNINIRSNQWSSSSVASYEKDYEHNENSSMQVTQRYPKESLNYADPLMKNNIGNSLPSQLQHLNHDRVFDIDELDNQSNHGYIPYIDPSSMRTMLEEYVTEHGESALDRDTLFRHNSALLFSLWWFSARFSLPLPLPVLKTDTMSNQDEPRHYCAFASFDKELSLAGCQSAALSLQDLINTNDLESPSWTEKFERGPSILGQIPLLENFNLQTFCQSDWENPLLSSVLIALVEACDKLDFRPVVDSIQQYALSHQKPNLCDKKTSDQSLQESSIGSPSDLTLSKYDLQTNGKIIDYSQILDCYRVIMYLARYQCTSAFHRFFPTTNAKPCKGYHFWCASGSCPCTSFDSLFEKAIDSKAQVPIEGCDKDGVLYNGISDVAMGFRCVFGHII